VTSASGADGSGCASLNFPSYIPGTGFHFRSLPRLARLGWSYSNAPLHGEIVHLDHDMGRHVAHLGK
jgi:hypothetical protein